MVILGYKAFNKNHTNRYNIPFEENKEYEINGPLKFGNNGNGFHMCKNFADVFRYFDSETSIVALVEGSGDHEKYEDLYYGYYDMYVVSKLKILKFLTREETIMTALSLNFFDTLRFIQTFKLKSDEIKLFVLKYANEEEILKAILYYQLGDTTIYKEYNKEKTKKLKEVYNNG